MMWPRIFRSTPGLLPPAVAGRRNYDIESVLNEEGMLTRQELKIRKDWAIVSRVFPRAAFTDYQYYWLIVNSRSFYYELLKAGVSSTNDHMVLCPLIDFFNHQDHGVSENKLQQFPQLIYSVMLSLVSKVF